MMIGWLERNWKLSLVILIFGFVSIFFVSSIEFSSGAVEGGRWKSIVYHFSAFFLLGMFLLIVLVRGRERENLVFAVLMGILYGISDELHQFLVPGRACTLGDVFLDSLGVLTALVVYGIVLERRKLY
jgi:VanZ family protein